MLREPAPGENLVELMNSRLAIIAIGPVTTETLLKIGLKVDVMPDKHLFEEAVIALARYWSAKWLVPCIRGFSAF